MIIRLTGNKIPGIIWFASNGGDGRDSSSSESRWCFRISDLTSCFIHIRSISDYHSPKITWYTRSSRIYLHTNYCLKSIFIIQDKLAYYSHIFKNRVQYFHQYYRVSSTKKIQGLPVTMFHWDHSSANDVWIFPNNFQLPELRWLPWLA